MSINAIEGKNTYTYSSQTNKLSAKDEFVDLINSNQQEREVFAVTDQEGNMDGRDKRYGKVPNKFAGMSFSDLMNCGEGRKNVIPVVNQIVSSRNPEDGEIYRVFFTNEKIICNNGEGGRAWEIDIENEQQAAKVKDFFAGYKPDNAWVKEYYSDDNMGVAAVKSFWLDLFEMI